MQESRLKCALNPVIVPSTQNRVVFFFAFFFRVPIDFVLPQLLQCALVWLFIQNVINYISDLIICWKQNSKIYFPFFSVKTRSKASTLIPQTDSTSTFQNHPAPFSPGSCCCNHRVHKYTLSLECNAAWPNRAVTSGSVSHPAMWGLHGHMLREHIGDVIPWVAVQTLFQPLLIQVMS